MILPKFDSHHVWEYLLGSQKVNIFSAVPTMYFKLLEEADKRPDRAEIKHKLAGAFKLFATASAPLNQKLSDQWFNLTGFRLIDRYGLTETSGIVLGNTVTSNILGTVGRPVNNFRIRLVSQSGLRK